MDKVKILWSGITGRTGQLALEVAKANDSVEIVAGICRNNNNFYHYDELDNIKEEFDVIVDFSHKDSFNKILEFALKTKKPIIIGTAGLTEEQIQSFEEAANIIPVFRGGNFRFEVKKFIDDVVEYAKTCEEEVIELVETHYVTVPIPSQTAQVIAKRVLEGTGKKVEIDSFQQSDENTNDWTVANLNYHCGAYDEKLAEDVLKIAEMMKNKKPKGVYDLDRLFREREMDTLSHFLIEAKKQTYANATIEEVKSSRIGSNDYHYEIKLDNKKMIYHDTYFGGTKFMGEEVVYVESDIPKWGMNCYGVTVDETLSEEAMDKALRPALMRVGEDDSVLPVRGPSTFEQDGYIYTFTSEGELDNFIGLEEIYKDKKLIYQLHCHGGFIKR